MCCDVIGQFYRHESGMFFCNTQCFRLVLFVKEANDKHKSALMNILFPVFISIYVDMLVGGLKQIGKLTLNCG